MSIGVNVLNRFVELIQKPQLIESKCVSRLELTVHFYELLLVCKGFHVAFTTRQFCNFRLYSRHQSIFDILILSAFETRYFCDFTIFRPD